MTDFWNGICGWLNTAGDLYWQFAVSMFLQVGLLVFLLLIADLVLLRRLRAGFRYGVWSLVLIKLVLPVSLSSPIGLSGWIAEETSRSVSAVTSPSSEPHREEQPALGAAPTVPPGAIELAAETIRSPERVSPAARPSDLVNRPSPALESPAFSLRWKAWVLLAWCGGVMGLGGSFFINDRRVRRLVSSSIEAPADLRDQFEGCLQSMGFAKGRLELRISVRLQSPAICGLRRPTILLPHDLVSRLDREQLRFVFLHEIMHWRRFDLPVNTLQTLLQIVYFYNPFVWLANAILRRVREQAVDEAVLVLIDGGRERYGATLLEIAARGRRSMTFTLGLIGVVESRTALAGRIRRIASRPLPKTARLGMFGTGAVLAVGLILLSLVGARPAADAEQPIDGAIEAVMSVDEQKAWNELVAMNVDSSEVMQRRHLQQHLATLERMNVPEAHRQKIRRQLQEPVPSINLWQAPADASPIVARLESLSEVTVTSGELPRAGFQSIAALPQLRRLSVINAQCLPTDAAALKLATGLETLDLTFTVFETSSASRRKLIGELTEAERAWADSYRETHDHHEHIIEAAILTDRMLEEFRDLPNLKVLRLANTTVSPRGAEAISAHAGLEELDVNFVDFSPKAAHTIGGLHQLRTLRYADATDDTLASLAGLTNLETLELWAGGVTDEGVRHLQPLKSLRSLALRGSSLSDAGLLELATLPDLQYLDLRFSKGMLTANGLAEFRRRKPQCRLVANVGEEKTPSDQPATTANEIGKSDAPDPAVPVFERTVSLTAKQMPLGQALQEITRQAGVRLELDRDALIAAKLKLDRPIDVAIEGLTLSGALRELIARRDHPGVFHEFRGETLLLSTAAARMDRLRKTLPAELKSLVDLGIWPILDADDEVIELYLSDELTDDVLAQLSVLPRLRKLKIGSPNRLTREGFTHLGELKALQTLQVHGQIETEVGDDIIRGVVGLESLRVLSLSECGTSDAGIKLLEQMPQLTSLNLYQEGRLTDAAIASIATLKNLETLNLTSYVGTEKYGFMRFSPEALRQISALSKLENLHLHGHEFPADSFAFPRLKSLSIGGQQVDDALAEKLLKCPELRSLSLSNTRITDAGLKHLATVPELRRLSLDQRSISDDGRQQAFLSDDGLRNLSTSPRLEFLELRSVAITDAGISHLARIKTLKRLEFSNTGNTITGLEQLKALPELRTLWLTGFQDKAGYHALAKLKHLRELHFEMCWINKEAYHKLEKALPQTRIMAGTGGGFLPSSRPDSIAFP